MHLTRSLYRAFVPYCLKRLEDKPCEADNCRRKSHSHQRWVVLNREYKPLGFGAGNRISYEPCAIEFKTPLRDATVAKLSLRGEVSHAGPDEFIFFYDDGCPPWRGGKFAKDYFQRLEVLMKLPAFVSSFPQAEEHES
jgi:hypothetical protein